MNDQDRPWRFRTNVADPSPYEAGQPIPLLQAVRTTAGEPAIKCQPNERGIVLAPKYEPMAPSPHAPKLPVPVDEEHFRSVLLFFDKIDVPTKHFGANTPFDPSVIGLGNANVAAQSIVQHIPIWGDAVSEADAITLSTFLTIDQQQPGQWVIGRTDDVHLPPEILAPERAFAITLSNALPSFARDVALEDILNFKTRYKAELLALRTEMDELVHQFIQGNFHDFSSGHLLRKFDAALRDHVRTVQGSNLRKVMRSLKVSVDLPSTVRFALATHAGMTAGLPLTGALLTAVGAHSAITITSEFGLGGLNERTGPFEYITAAERNLF